MKLRFCMAQNAGYFNESHQFFLFSFRKIALKIGKVIYSCSTNALNLIFLNSIQNSHVHEPSKLVENLHREKPNL